jgi:F-box-like
MQFTGLPNETKFYIFSFLNQANLFEAKLVCRNWRNIACDAYLGRPRLPADLLVQQAIDFCAVSCLAQIFVQTCRSCQNNSEHLTRSTVRALIEKVPLDKRTPFWLSTTLCNAVAGVVESKYLGPLVENTLLRSPFWNPRHPHADIRKYWNRHQLTTFAYHGEIYSLKHILDQINPDALRLLNYAIYSGSLETVQYLFTRTSEKGKQILRKRIQPLDHFGFPKDEIMEFLIANNFKLTRFIIKLARRGNLKLLKKFKKRGDLDHVKMIGQQKYRDRADFVLRSAAAGGHLRIIKWMLKKYQNNEYFRESIIIGASTFGHQYILEWLRCTTDESMDWFKICAIAAQNDQYELFDKYFPRLLSWQKSRLFDQTCGWASLDFFYYVLPKLHECCDKFSAAYSYSVIHAKISTIIPRLDALHAAGFKITGATLKGATDRMKRAELPSHQVLWPQICEHIKSLIQN